MGIKRIGKHLLEHRWRVRRIFRPPCWRRSSRRSRPARPRIPARSASWSKARSTARRCSAISRRGERALDIFSQLRIWDTAHNNGVLIYLLLADRNVEIVADRGIDAKVGAAGWEKICADMEAEFKAVEFRGRRDQGNRGGLAGTGEVFSRARRGAERTAGCAGGDLSTSSRHSADAAQRACAADAALALE